MTVADPDLDLLADLDAGLLDPQQAAAVRAAAAADPRSAAVLDALAATRAELGALGPPPVPPGAARSWAAALATAGAGDGGAPDADRQVDTGSSLGTIPADGPAPAPKTGHPSAPPAATGPVSATGPHPATDRDPVARRRRPSPRADRSVGPDRSGPRPADRVRRRARRAAGAAVAVVLAAGIVVSAVSADRDTGTRTDLTGVDLVAVARSTIGMDELGPLDAPAPRSACLARLGAADDLAGGRTVLFDGVPGVLIVLTTGVLGRFRFVVVDDACSAVLADSTFGG